MARGKIFGGLGSFGQGFANNIYKQQAAGDEAQAAPYRAALEKATYAQLGPQFSQGLDKITNYLAGQGPLADSGARQALSSRLASGIYNTATGQIGGKYADYLAQIANQRRQYQYQMALMKQQKKNQKTGIGGVVGGIAGGALGFMGGGPAGAAAGYGLGSRVGGGGGGGNSASAYGDPGYQYSGGYYG